MRGFSATLKVLIEPAKFPPAKDVILLFARLSNGRAKTLAIFPGTISRFFRFAGRSQFVSNEASHLRKSKVTPASDVI